MYKFFIITLLLIITGSLFAQGVTLSTSEGLVTLSSTEAAADGRITTGSIIDTIASRLETLEKDYFIKLNKVDQLKAQKLVNEIYELLAQIPLSTDPVVISGTSPNISININTPGVAPKPKPESASATNRKVMKDQEFSDLMTKISRQVFGDDRLRTLELVSQNTRFTVNQIVRIIGTFTFASDQLNALRICYPECVDPQNNYKILDSFTFSTDRDAAQKIMEGK